MCKKVLVAICFGALLTALIVWIALRKRPVVLEIASPNGDLVLRLTGDPSRPATPFLDHSVYFDLARNAQPVLVDRFFHYGDWLDPSFNDLYTQHRWLSNTTIQFMRLTAPEDKRDTLVVRNDTDKTISYLLIESLDKFLVFSLTPRSEVKLRPYPQSERGDLSWIEVEGEFADKQSIPWKGVNFKIDRKDSFDYYISINASGALVTSAQLTEYRSPD